MVSAEFIGLEKHLSLLEAMQGGTLDAIKKEMERQAIALQNKVKNDYLSGQVLNVRTGHLKRSITEKVTSDGQGHFEGIVGTNIKYGRYWELGFDRKVGTGARGGPKTITSAITLAKYMLAHPPGQKHYNARPFLKPALLESAPAIRAALEAALRKATRL